MSKALFPKVLPRKAVSNGVSIGEAEQIWKSVVAENPGASPEALWSAFDQACA